MERAVLPGQWFLSFSSYIGVGALKTSRVSHKNGREAAVCLRSPNKSWLSWVGLAVAVGITYFMAARFGLAFRAKPGGVAVFWPAAGIAIGALIALGPDARLPVAAAVAVATITSKLLITGNFLLGITFGVVCAGQTLLTAWLIERWFGRAFKLEDAPQVAGVLGGKRRWGSISGSWRRRCCQSRPFGSIPSRRVAALVCVMLVGHGHGRTATDWIGRGCARAAAAP